MRRAQLAVLFVCALALACAPPASTNRKKKDAGSGTSDTGFNPTGDTGDTTAATTGDTGTDDAGTDDTGADTTGDDVTSTDDTGTDETGEDTGPDPDTGSADTGDDTGSTGEPPPLKDADDDGVADKDDNCVFDANPEQLDLDDDSLGDICDPDKDGDGIVNENDCEPEDETIFPGNPEKCDEIDNNCDGDIDGIGSFGGIDYFTDEDGDGAGITDTGICLCVKAEENQVPFAGDCNDENPTINPWAYEICNDLDENCNLIIDDGCDDDGDGWCDANMLMEGSPSICPNGGGDCFDWSAAVNPNAIEIDSDGLDNDCDGTKKGETTGKLEPDCSGYVCFGKSNDAITCGLDLCYPGLDIVKSVSVGSPDGSSYNQAYEVVDHFGNKTNDLAPFGPPSYVLLASGPATGTQHSTDIGGGFGAGIPDPFSKDGYSTYNNVEITMKLKAPPGAKGFSIDYIYMSEEYEEFIGSSFNDKFYIILTAPQTTGNAPTVINFTNCSDPGGYFDFEKDGKKWCYIAINTAFSEPCNAVVTDISGTGFECGPGGSSNGSSTGWLQTTWPIESEEEFTLVFHIHDTSDGIYDSEVILDNFVWEADTVEGGTASHN